MKIKAKIYHAKYPLTLVAALALFLSLGSVPHDAFADKVVDSISLGSYVPGSVAVNPNTDRIYVADPSNNTVSVIDGLTDSVVGTIQVRPGPAGIAADPIADKIYVSHPADGTITVIDGSTNSISNTIQIPGGPSCIAVNPNIDMIYVLQSSIKNVAVIDGTDGKIVYNIPYTSGYGIWTYCLGVNPSTDRFYVSWATNPDTHIDHYIDVYNGSTNSVITHIGTLSQNSGFSLGSFGADTKSDMIYAVASSYPNNYVVAINGTTNSVARTMQFQLNSNGIDVNPYTHNIYLANHDNNTVYIINGTASTVSGTIHVGKSPAGVAVNQDTDRIYVTNQGDNTVSVIQGSSPPPQLATSQLRVNSRDALGNILTGFQAELFAQNGTKIGAGYTSHSFTLDNGKSYTVQVGGSSQYFFDHWSDTGSASPARDISLSHDGAIIAIYKTFPQPPTGLAATVVSPSQVNLSWTGPAYDGGSPITGYKVERSTDGGMTWMAISSNTGSANTSYPDLGAAAGSTYMYRVSSINSVGPSIPSDAAVATSIVLDNVKATSGTVSSQPYAITLANFDSGTGNNRLLVVGVSANNNNAASVTFGGMSLTMATSSFYNNDAEFWYLKNPPASGDIIVTMSNSTSAVVGAYAFSGVDLANPIPAIATNHNNASGSPTISITASSPTSVVLDLPSISGWHTLSSPTCTQGWDVNMPNAVTGASSTVIVPSAGTVTCSWAASSGGDLWDDVAIEVKASGYNAGSATVPSSPTGLMASPVSSSQIHLSWTAPSSDGGSPITGYKIERTASGNTAWSAVQPNTGSAATSYNDAGLQPDISYTYRVSAINAIGPSQPSGAASATTSFSVTHALMVDSQDYAGNALPGFYDELYANNGTQLDSGYTPNNFTLNSDENYTVHVENYGNYKFSHWLDSGSTDANRTISISSDDSIIASYATIPTHPANLTATAVSSSQINLSWDAPSSDGGSPITAYRIQSSTDGSTWTTIVKNTGNTNTAYSDTGLSPGTTYYYRVFALNSVGSSYRSNVASDTTPLLSAAGVNIGPASMPISPLH